jgi:hypothetical protein
MLMVEGEAGFTCEHKAGGLFEREHAITLRHFHASSNADLRVLPRPGEQTRSFKTEGTAKNTILASSYMRTRFISSHTHSRLFITIPPHCWATCSDQQVCYMEVESLFTIIQASFIVVIHLAANV